MDMPTIKDIIALLEAWAPPAAAEDFDNVGLLVGDANRICTGALITLDALDTVVDEAITKNCNFIISFHPIIFSGLKSITGKNYVEKTVLKALENKIAIYALHTALDNHPKGVNYGIAQKIGMQNNTFLLPKKDSLKKLRFYAPSESVEKIKEALFAEGAGALGNYTKCSFENEGLGQYQPNEEAQPSVGKKGEHTQVVETQVQLVFETHLQSKILHALHKVHPYEEIAFEIYTPENDNPNRGMGSIGVLSTPTNEEAFLQQLKKVFNPKCIRHSQLLGKPIQRVAVLGGSGSFAIGAAKQQKADVYITADLKYHDFYQAEGELLLIDLGHYESEQFTKNLILDYLSKKMPNFAFILAATNTNPINYF